MSIRDLIALPESKTLEFKEKMPEHLAIEKNSLLFRKWRWGNDPYRSG